MRKPHISRSLIALVAAYLVALQALILPLSLPAAAAHAGGLCITAPDGPAPVGQGHGCPCAAGCGTQCDAPALGATAGLPAPCFAVAARLAPPPLTSPPAPIVRGPQMPRGPPVA